MCGACGTVHRAFYDHKARLVRDLSCGDTRVYLELAIGRVFCRTCGTVKREALGFLSDNPFYTKRFACYVGRRCRASSIKDVAKELRLDWHTVKELEKQYMREQLRRAGTPVPKIIGIDEVSIRLMDIQRDILHRPLHESRSLLLRSTGRARLHGSSKGRAFNMR